MAKSRKLMVWLLIIALLLAGFWLVLGRPSLTARGVLHRTEGRELRKESLFLGDFFLTDVLRIGTGHLDYHVVVGKTEDELRLVEAIRQGPVWHSEEDMVVIPLQDPVTADFQPWCAEWQQTAFVYTDLVYDHGVAVVTVGGRTFDSRFEPSESGFAVVSFPYLEADRREEGVLSEQVQLRQFDLRNVGYAKDRKVLDVTLEVVLYDSANNEVAHVVNEYPAS